MAPERKKKRDDHGRSGKTVFKLVYMNDKGETQDLTEEDIRQLTKDNPTLESYLVSPESIPLSVLEQASSETWQKTATKLLNQISRLKNSVWFSEPVDPVKYNIMDYFDIISRPMDLGTLKKKLQHNCYLTHEEFMQ